MHDACGSGLFGPGTQVAAIGDGTFYRRHGLIPQFVCCGVILFLFHTITPELVSAFDRFLYISMEAPLQSAGFLL